MRPATESLKIPLLLAVLWMLAASVSVLAAPAIIATVPYWHDARSYLAQLGLWQAWISIAACVGLLVISRRKHAESEEAWAQGAVLIYVLGGVLTAILLNYGVLPRWLVNSVSLLLMTQVLVLALLHWCCALLCLRSLLRYRKERMGA